MREKVLQALAAAAGAVASFFCGMPPLVWVLLAVMSLDYITGILCGLMGKSNKTEHGGISSGAAFRGLLKKVLILIIVLVAALVDHAVALSADIEFAAVTGATCLWFIASESMSILENAAAMGVKIPGVLQRVLEIMHDKGSAQQTESAKKE